MKTYAFEIGLERRQDFLYGSFDKHTTDETEALAIRVGFGRLGEGVDYQSVWEAM